MTLKQLIAELEARPAHLEVEFDYGLPVGRLYSWRGVYAELTLAPADLGEVRTVQEVLDDAREALNGKVFHGYKGGDYTMKPHTPVWADDYGKCNYNGIMGTRAEGQTLVLVTADLSDYR